MGSEVKAKKLASDHTGKNMASLSNYDTQQAAYPSNKAVTKHGEYYNQCIENLFTSFVASHTPGTQMYSISKQHGIDDDGNSMPIFHCTGQMPASTTLPAYKRAPGAELSLLQKSDHKHALAEQQWNDLLWSPDAVEVSVGVVGMLIIVFTLHIHTLIHSSTWQPLSCSKL